MSDLEPQKPEQLFDLIKMVRPTETCNPVLYVPPLVVKHWLRTLVDALGYEDRATSALQVKVDGKPLLVDYPELALMVSATPGSREVPAKENIVTLVARTLQNFNATQQSMQCIAAGFHPPDNSQFKQWDEIDDQYRQYVVNLAKELVDQLTAHGHLPLGRFYKEP